VSDRFSVDDILNEISEKKGGKPNSGGDIAPKRPPFSEGAESLTEEIAKIERERFGAVPELEPVKSDVGVTQILDGLLTKPDLPKSDLSVTQILNGEIPAEEAPQTSEHPAIVKPVQLRRFTPPAGGKRTGRTSELPKLPSASDEKESEKEKEKEKKPEKSIEDITGDVVPVEKPAKPAYLLPEEKERLQKLREEELLEKELALEDPDELLDGINPYDVKNIETPTNTEVEKIRMTADASVVPVQVREAHEKFDEQTLESIVTPMASGLPQTDEIEIDEDDVKINEKDNKKLKGSKNSKEKKRSFKENLDNSALLETLNASISKKRAADKDARRTLNVDTLSTVTNSVKTAEIRKDKPLPAKLNINYKKQIIEDSAVLVSISDIHSKQIEERELGKKKKRKIRDFILEDIDDDDDFVYEEEDTEGEYDGYDSSAAIWQDLIESHKGLKWRFALLFLITAFLTFLMFVHDSGRGNTGLRGTLTSMFFGADNLTGYATGLVFVNLIAGVVGMVICSGVIMRGMKNLFLGRADCDSLCAVPIVLTTLGSIVHITSNRSTALIEQNLAHLYVNVALAGLMFNTLGKMFMIVRAKKNFQFISGDSVKYSALMPNTAEDTEARIFTKGILNSPPMPVFLRKTEFLTDFLKNSYCTDWADLICRKIVPIAAGLSILAGIIAFILPVGNPELAGNIRWAVTVSSAFIAALAPFSVMFLVNNPLLKAARSLTKNDSVVMGYSAVQRFSKANAVVIDAGVLFPAGSVKFLNVKRCQKPNAINSITIDESIIIAASLAIKGNSIMSSMFNDMISNNTDLLYKIENCIYEVNMGITGWMGTKRVMLGNRAQMKHHSIDVPAVEKEKSHLPGENAEVVYLAVGSETVAMFFIEVVPNSAVKHALWELDADGIALAVKSRDSLVTVAKLADIFELNPERVRVLPFDQHNSFDEYSKYVSRGNSEIACNGTFTSFARTLTTAKSLIRDMMFNSAVMLVSVFLAGILGLIFVVLSASGAMSSSTVMMYNLIWLGIMFVLQAMRRY
jgi:Cu+-exporting ATPase